MTKSTEKKHRYQKHYHINRGCKSNFGFSFKEQHECPLPTSLPGNCFDWKQCRELEESHMNLSFADRCTQIAQSLILKLVRSSVVRTIRSKEKCLCIQHLLVTKPGEFSIKQNHTERLWYLNTWKKWTQLKGTERIKCFASEIWGKGSSYKISFLY